MPYLDPTLDEIGGIFQVDGVSPTELVVLNTSGASTTDVGSSLPTFQFVVPSVNDGPQTPFRIPEFTDLQINFYSTDYAYVLSSADSQPAGGLWADPNSNGGTWTGPSGTWTLVYQGVGGYRQTAGGQVAVWTFTPSASFWYSVLNVIDPSGGSVSLLWNVEADADENSGGGFVYSPGYMSQTSGLTASPLPPVPILNGVWVYFYTPSGGGSPDIAIAAAPLNTYPDYPNFQVASEEFYESTSGGAKAIGSVSAPNGTGAWDGDYVMETGIDASHYSAFWAVGFDSGGNAVTNWQGAEDGGDGFTGLATSVAGGPWATGDQYYGPGQTVALGIEFTGPTGDPVTSVSFYSDPDGTPADATLIGTASGTNASGYWSFSFDSSEYNPATVYAVGNNQSGYASAWFNGSRLLPDLPPVIDVFTAPNTYTPGASVGLDVNQIWTADGNVPSLEFYLDNTGTGTYVPGQTQALGPGTLDGSGLLSLTVPGATTSAWVGPETVFAVATDDLGLSTYAAFTIDSTAPPLIDDLTSSSPTYNAGDVITLTANVTTGDGNLSAASP